MRLGSDALKYPGGESMSPLEILLSIHQEGLAGVFYRTMLTMSPTLDSGELAEIGSAASERGMYLESGVGKVNPFGMPETPELRAIGDGDTLLGFRRMMEAAAALGITELWAATANIKRYPGRFAYDRFRTDVDWADQLAATEKFLRKLAPIARDLGLHINLETHEEITSFELVRLVEAVGADVMGITFDTANVVQRAEHPVWAARRVAPYVRQSHIKDTALFREGAALAYQMRPNGQGVVDLVEILPILNEHNPQLNLSLELAQVTPTSGDGTKLGSRRLTIDYTEPEWLAAHPDLTGEELEALLTLAEDYEARIQARGLPGYADYVGKPATLDEARAYMHDSIAYVREAAASTGTRLA